jgi:hypothetical protein
MKADPRVAKPLPPPLAGRASQPHCNPAAHPNKPGEADAVRRPLGLHRPVMLLVCSNVFMTLAWCGHLNFKAKSLILVALASWGIAFAEYCLAVPANRYGHAVYSAAELKTIQEVIPWRCSPPSPCSISGSRWAGTTPSASS